MKKIFVFFLFFAASLCWAEIRISGIPGVQFGGPLDPGLIARMEAAGPKLNTGNPLTSMYALSALPEYKKISDCELMQLVVTTTSGMVTGLQLHFNASGNKRETIYKWLESSYGLNARPFVNGTVTYNAPITSNYRKSITVNQTDAKDRILVYINQEKAR